jgi:hypothetical protein
VIEVANRQAARVAGHRNVDFRRELSLVEPEQQRDGIQIGVGDRDVGEPIAVEVAGRELEWSATHHDFLERLEALPFVSVPRPVIEQDANRGTLGSAERDVGPAVTIEVAGDNRSWRADCGGIESVERKGLRTKHGRVQQCADGNRKRTDEPSHSHSLLEDIGASASWVRRARKALAPSMCGRNRCAMDLEGGVEH